MWSWSHSMELKVPHKFPLITGAHCYLPSDETEYAWQVVKSWITPAIVCFSWLSFVICCCGIPGQWPYCGIEGCSLAATIPTISWKPSLCSSQTRASCFKAALIRLSCFVITRLVCSGMRNVPYVDVGLAAWWWIEALEIVFVALHKTLTLVLFGYSQSPLPGYLIKSQQIIFPNTSCGYSSTLTYSILHTDRHTHTVIIIALNGNNVQHWTELSDKQILHVVSIAWQTFNTAIQ